MPPQGMSAIVKGSPRGAVVEHKDAERYWREAVTQAKRMADKGKFEVGSKAYWAYVMAIVKRRLGYKLEPKQVAAFVVTSKLLDYYEVCAGVRYVPLLHLSDTKKLLRALDQPWMAEQVIEGKSSYWRIPKIAPYDDSDLLIDAVNSYGERMGSPFDVRLFIKISTKLLLIQFKLDPNSFTIPLDPNAVKLVDAKLANVKVPYSLFLRSFQRKLMTRRSEFERDVDFTE